MAYTAHGAFKQRSDFKCVSSPDPLFFYFNKLSIILTPLFDCETDPYENVKYVLLLQYS